MKRLMLLKASAVAAIVTVAAGYSVSSYKPPTKPVITQPVTVAETCTVNTDELLGYINAERVAIGVTPLVEDIALDNSSSAKLNDMIAGQYFGHNNLDGSPPWARFTDAGVHGNLSEDIDEGGLTPQKDWQTLKDSPEHYASLTSALYERVGLSSKCVDFTLKSSTGPADNSNLVGLQIKELTVIHLASAEPPVTHQATCASVCNDGLCSQSVGSGTCSSHDGVDY